MAFKRTTDKTFRAEVRVNVANAQGGYDENTFTAVYKHATTSELDELRKLPNGALVRDRMVGWDLQDAETNETVPFSAEALDALLLIPPTPHAAATAFWEQIGGARAKNL